MKIRWTDNSLRFRITPTELQKLSQGDEIIETLRVPNVAWTARLLATSAENGVESKGAEIAIKIGAASLKELSEPASEGVYFKSPNGLRYFIEKDFPCAHPSAIEAQEVLTETFAPPAGFNERKKRV